MLNLFDQTTFSDRAAGTHGDCFRACIATVLQIDPNSLPHPIADGGGWSGAFWPALRKLGFTVRTIDHDGAPDDRHLADGQGFIIPRVVMAAGDSPRGQWLHSVVWDRYSGKMIHDPHPSRDGLTCVRSLDFLAPYSVSEE